MELRWHILVMVCAVYYLAVMFLVRHTHNLYMTGWLFLRQVHRNSEFRTSKDQVV